MSRTASPSTHKPYSLARVCRGWRLGRSTVYWQRLSKPGPAPRRRPGPLGFATDDYLVQHIKDTLAQTPFHGEGYRKVWGPAAVCRYQDLEKARAQADAGIPAPGAAPPGPLPWAQSP